MIGKCNPGHQTKERTSPTATLKLVGSALKLRDIALRHARKALLDDALINLCSSLYPVRFSFLLVLFSILFSVLAIVVKYRTSIFVVCFCQAFLLVLCVFHQGYGPHRTTFSQTMPTRMTIQVELS